MNPITVNIQDMITTRQTFHRGVARNLIEGWDKRGDGVETDT